MKILTSLCNIYIWLTTCLLQVTVINDFISRYLFADIGYLKWLAIVMILDLITGITKVYVHLGFKAVTSKMLRDTVSKVIQYGAFLIIVHVITHYEINDVKVLDAKWLSRLSMEFILIIESKSVYENIVQINPKFDFISAIWSKMVKYFPVKDKLVK